jgi:hypothetical protein
MKIMQTFEQGVVLVPFAVVYVVQDIAWNIDNCWGGQEISAFMEPKGSSPYSQEPISDP